MTATKHFENGLLYSYPHLMRHFKRRWRRRLARFILGDKAIYNLIYDAAQTGWGIGQSWEKGYRDPTHIEKGDEK